MCAASINLCTLSQDHSSALAQLAWLSGIAGADVLCDQRGVTIAAWCISVMYGAYRRNRADINEQDDKGVMRCLQQEDTFRSGWQHFPGEGCFCQ